jgi:hypothetical protein
VFILISSRFGAERQPGLQNHAYANLAYMSIWRI